VRTKRWKWIEANAGNPRGLPEKELFEIEADPGERNNVAANEPGTAAEMARQAQSLEVAAREHKVGEAKAARISREECLQLKQLGYVQDCGPVQ
jgi:hypothetical protein